MATQVELTEDTKKYIAGRKYMISMVEKARDNFKFSDFDGSYTDYLKYKRHKFDYQIDKYNEDIESAIYLDDNSSRFKKFKLDF